MAAPASDAADPSPAPAPERRPLELGALFASVVAFGLAHSAYFLLPKYLAVELHADPAQIGVYTSLTWFANVAIVPLAGVWIDRRGRLPFACLGAGALAVTCAGYFAIDSLGPLLIVLRLAHGFAFTFFFIATQTLAADLARPEHLGRVLGYYGSGFVMTNAIAPALAEWLAGRAGWGWVFGVTTVLALVSLGLLAMVRERHAGHSAGGDPVPGIRTTLARPGFARVLGVASLAGVAFAAAFTFHQPFALSLGIHRVSDFLVSYSIAAMLVRGPFGSIADRAGRMRVTSFSLAAYAVASFASTQLESLGLAATGALFGVAHGLFYPALNAAALRGASADVRAKVTGLFNGAFNAGFSLGSIALGYVALGFGFPPVFAIAGLCSLAALGLLYGRAPGEDASE